MDIECKINLSQEQIEQILKDYVENNTKFTPESFKFNVERESYGFGSGYDYIFSNVTINVKLKD